MTTFTDEQVALPTVFVDEPLQCSQGGVPYNKAHIDARDGEIRRLRSKITALTQALAQAQARVQMLDAIYENECMRRSDLATELAEAKKHLENQLDKVTHERDKYMRYSFALTTRIFFNFE